MTLVEQPETRTELSGRQSMVLLGHAFALWALCAASMMIGLAVASEETALVVHAIGAPIFAGVVGWNYYRRFGYTTPLQTAAAFISFVVVVDFFLVALIINRSLEMFASLLGTWIPFALIFGSAYLVGTWMERTGGYASQRR